ncbi:hypothetical protein Dimus_009284 [Dionaea muscipula]
MAFDCSFQVLGSQFITFTHVTMESDKYICVRETAPRNSVVIIDMNMPMQPLRRRITADFALINPNTTLKDNMNSHSTHSLEAKPKSSCSFKFAPPLDLSSGVGTGGYIDCYHGVWRIQGSLAVSRGIGDRHLKQWVIAEPETTTHKIESDYEILVLASDGLWDKLSNQEAVDVARPLCIGTSKTEPLAACQKIEISVSCGSCDDISVMLIQQLALTTVLEPRVLPSVLGCFRFGSTISSHGQFCSSEFRLREERSMLYMIDITILENHVMNASFQCFTLRGFSAR